MKKLILVSALTLLTTACTTTPEECDPSVDPGFFNKIGCTVSGSYEKRIEQKESQLQKLQDENVYLSEILASLEDRERLVYGTIAERKQVLASINANLDKLEQDLAAKNKLTDELKAKIEKTKSTVGAEQNEIQIEYKKRQKVLEDLQSEIADYEQLVVM